MKRIKWINSLYLTRGARNCKECPPNTVQERETLIAPKLQNLNCSYWFPGNIRLVAATKSKLCWHFNQQPSHATIPGYPDLDYALLSAGLCKFLPNFWSSRINFQKEIWAGEMGEYASFGEDFFFLGGGHNYGITFSWWSLCHPLYLLTKTLPFT